MKTCNANVTGGNVARMIAVGKITVDRRLQQQCEGWIDVNPIDAPEILAAGSTFNFHGSISALRVVGREWE